MRLFKRFVAIALALSVSIAGLQTSSFAATEWTTGTAFVTDENNPAVDFVMQGSVFYNSWTTTALDIDAMQTRVWNNGQVSIAGSYFAANNGINAHSSDYATAQFWGLGGDSIPVGATNQITYIDWSQLVSLYNDGSDTAYEYSVNNTCVIDIGVKVEAYSVGNYDYYYYAAEWYNNGIRTTETYGF